MSDGNHEQAEPTGGAPGPARGESGEAAHPASRAVDETDLDALDADERQDVLMDEAVEETFPASDPVSPKRIT
ncbi:MAG TPA: hypothetical protein VNA30_03335 [Mycobacteriales bacterium]|nr:hypothetical protein [Mycobacteriales bacterium]